MNIYKEIARKYGVTEEDVRRDMQVAIDEAYDRLSASAQSVFGEGDVPTPEDIIGYITSRILASDDT